MNVTSQKKLSTCHKDLVKLANALDKIYPIQVICGYRSKEEQNLAVKNGKSGKPWPSSKHNQFPSLAMDIVPDPDKNPATLDWKDKKEFELMCLTIKQVADDLSIKIRLGKAWGDFPHIELV